MPSDRPASVYWLQNLDGVAEAYAPELYPHLKLTASFTVGAEAADVIRVTANIGAGLAVSAAHLVYAWLSDTAAVAVTGTAPDGGVVAATGTVIETHTANRSWFLKTSAAGVVALDLTHAAGARTWFLNVQLPNGAIASSAAITFAA